jgi:uncharacterized membrane protein
MTQLEPTIPLVAKGSAGRAKVRKITNADVAWAFQEAWKDFQDRRGDLLVLAVIYPLIAFLAAAISFDSKLLPMFFPLVAGLSILGPAVASGFYELARRREVGEDAGWRHFIDPLQGRSRVSLLLLSLGLFVLFLGWLGAASLVYQATLGLQYPTAFEFLSRLFTTPQGLEMILLGNLVGLIFAVATLCLALVSFPMVVDKVVDPFIAVATSLAAVRANPGPVANFGIRVAALLFLGCLPAFVGLAVVLPVLGYASWHLYTRLVER